MIRASARDISQSSFDDEDRGHFGFLIQSRPRRCDAIRPAPSPGPAGPGAATLVKQMNAVMPTAMAPKTAKIVGQVGDGIAIWAISCVAL